MKEVDLMEHYYSKSKFVLFQGCHKRLWLELFKKEELNNLDQDAFLEIEKIRNDEVIFEKAKQFHAERLEEEQRAHNAEQRKNIEERKRKLLEEKQAGKAISHGEEKYVPIKVNLGREN